MRSPIVRRSTHEAALQTAAEARDQASEQVLREANQAELAELALQMGVLLGTGTEGEQTDRGTARRRFRAPIERVEAVARDRFGAVARQAGLQSRSPREWHKYWSSYYNFHPNSNVNVTQPAPIADTATGTLAVELGTVWDLENGSLNNPEYSRKPHSQTAFFARVLNIRDKAPEPETVSYVRLGRWFSAAEVEDSGSVTPVHSTHPGGVVLGKQTELERDFLKQSEPEAQAATLGRVEQAAAAFMVLLECAANQTGAETHQIDADAVSLAISVSRVTS